MTKKEIREALTLTLEQMPNYFTSRMFCLEARKYGITDYHVKSQVTNSFLKKHCTNDSVYKRSWHKAKPSLSQHQIFVGSNTSDLDIDRAIARVREAGYIVCRKEIKLVEI